MNIRKIVENGVSHDRVFGSSAFTDVIFSRSRQKRRKTRMRTVGGDVVIEVYAADIRPEQRLHLVGDCDILGNWKPSRSLDMDDAEFPMWRIRIPSHVLPERFEYKFIVVNGATGRLVAWEEGFNRVFSYPRPAAGEVLQVEARSFTNPVKWKGAGVAIPVFSLRSEQSFGVGEFEDLKLLADWAAATGLSAIQVLPVNDTTALGTWRDSYPYRANSIYALHPQFINLRKVGLLRSKAAQARFDKLGRELNALPEVDYERVNKAKHEYLHKIYEQQGAALFATQGYADFFKANSSWLVPYAAYSVLRDENGEPDFNRWKEHSVYDEADIRDFVNSNADKVGYYYFVQYHLHCQLQEARDYAHSKGVIIKGDIPIGIGRTSVDAWTSPELFRMDSSAGAPPDDFSVKGQNWGFPTYDWARMSQDGYAWWRGRFVKMNDYFDAYRIDHILGFFRIWEIPLDAVSALLGHFSPAIPYDAAEIWRYGFPFDRNRHTAPVSVTEDVLFVEDPRREGYYHPRISAQSTDMYASLPQHEKDAYNRLYDDFFYRRHNDFWRREAVEKLVPLISSTRMLVCGEDLGMIPACVPDVMRELQILSLEIQFMPKTVGVEFENTRDYPYFSVCTPSTHDMANIRLWWAADAGRRQRYYNNVLECEWTAPEECEPWICEMIVRQQLESSSMLAIIPLQDWLSIDGNLRRDDPAQERINDPANPDQYWRYRMHLTLEQLLTSEDFNGRLREMMHRSGRN